MGNDSQKDSLLSVSYFGSKAVESDLNQVSLQMGKCLSPLFPKHARGGRRQLRGMLLTPEGTC